MSHLYLLGVASLTLTSAGFAGSDLNADLQNRLEAAEARIAELSADQNQNWLNDERADAVRSLVQDVLADADTRASLQGGGSNAGYDGGFTIASGDGNWSLTMNGMVNTRWTSTDDETVALGAGDTDGGFETPTSWMNWSGTIAGDWSWDVRHDWDDGGLDWANATWNVGDGWDLTIGTFRLHTGRTAQIDDWAQMELDGNDAGDAANGLSLAYSGDDMRFWAEWTNGGADGSANDGEYDTNFRLEYMSEGNWGQFDQFTSADGGAAGTLLGFTYTSQNNAGDTDGDVEWGIDAQMQFGGSSLYVAYSDFSDDTVAAGEGDWNQTDVMWAMYLDSDWEVYIAYSDNDGDDGETTSIGVNNYWAGQNAKWTTQYKTDETNDDGEDITTLSTNIQLYF